MLDCDYKKIHKRMAVIAVIFLAFLVSFGMRAYTIQVINGGLNLEQAKKRTIGWITLKARRGLIYDRQMGVLVLNRQVLSLMANPRMMTPGERAGAKALLRRLFQLPETILDRLDNRTKDFVWIKRRLSLRQVEDFDEAVAAMPESKRPERLRLTMEDRRSYPEGVLAAPILGYTDIDLKGQTGIEKRFEGDLHLDPLTVDGLRGHSGKISLESLDQSYYTPSGDHVVLTIDKGVQSAAERVIRKTVEEHEAAWGVAIVMEPGSGAVLAMAQWPTFHAGESNRLPVSRLHNYALEWTFEPGSTLKPLVIAKALEGGRYKPDDIIDCGDGKFQIGPDTIHDSGGSRGYGELTLTEVLSKSSNICTAKIGLDLGALTVYRTLLGFGLGRKTGIRLTAETRGLLPGPGDWAPIELATISFGQGLNVSAIQLAAAYAAIANGGLYVRPRIVERVVTSDGDLKKAFEPDEGRRVIDERVAREITRMLVAAVSDGGTGGRARLDDCPVAGKTGTAEKLAKNAGLEQKEFWTSNFVGFLPADDPRLVILVVVDEPGGKLHHGGAVAAPAFKAIAEEVAPMLGICAMRPARLAEAK